MKKHLADSSNGKTTEEALNELRTILNSGDPLPRSRTLWGGADVVICLREPPANREPGFYPEPRRVCSVHARELSWLFNSLRDAFAIESLLDGCTKIEFYGRLANAANSRLRTEPDISAAGICSAVLDEAEKIYGEMKNHEFEFLRVAFDGEIADDRKKRP